jgi:hypothetical protein
MVLAFPLPGEEDTRDEETRMLGQMRPIDLMKARLDPYGIQGNG